MWFRCTQFIIRLEFGAHKQPFLSMLQLHLFTFIQTPGEGGAGPSGQAPGPSIQVRPGPTNPLQLPSMRLEIQTFWEVWRAQIVQHGSGLSK